MEPAMDHRIEIHYAPWTQRFKTVCCAGRTAYELQVGPLVIQWFYKPNTRAQLFGHLHLWRDRYWRDWRGPRTSTPARAVRVAAAWLAVVIGRHTRVARSR